MNNLEIYCVTDKDLLYLKNLPCKLAGVGKSNFSKEYNLANTLDNIDYKEKYYSELTFHYWFWKNEIKNLENNTWIGFCQKRRFWIKKNVLKRDINTGNFKNFILSEPSEEWKNYNSVICDPIYVNGVNKVKLLKRGFKSLIRDPRIFFNKEKQTVKLHFDMHHGHGNLDKAINFLDDSDRSEFKNYVDEIKTLRIKDSIDFTNQIAITFDAFHNLLNEQLALLFIKFAKNLRFKKPILGYIPSIILEKKANRLLAKKSKRASFEENYEYRLITLEQC